jgi:glycosyltransferase involved in cell wall biosynthesis
MANICFFNTTKFWGGGEKWHLETAIELESRGNKVCFIAANRGSLHKKLHSTNIEYHLVDMNSFTPINPFAKYAIKEFLEENNIEVVIFNGPKDVKLGGPVSVKAGVANRIYRRGLSVPVKSNFYNEYLYGSVITHFITNSVNTQEQLTKYLKDAISGNPIKLLYNGIDTEIADKPPSLKRVKDEIIIGTIGRLVDQKGHIHLIKVADILNKKGVDFMMYIGGKGKNEELLLQEIKRKKLQNKVVILGYINDPQRLIKSFDIFALPSEWEGFGYVMAEAMLMKKPVVAFDVSSNPEVVDENETGFLAPAFDIKIFAEKLITLAKDEQLRKSMGEKGYHKVINQFCKSKQTDKLENFIEELVSKQQPADS